MRTLQQSEDRCESRSDREQIQELLDFYQFSPHRDYSRFGFEPATGAPHEERYRFDTERTITSRSTNGDVVATAAVWRHDFESATLGLDVHRCTSLYTVASERVDHTARLAHDILNLVRGDTPAVVVLRVDADDTEALIGAQRAGFFVAEAAATFTSPPQPELPYRGDFGLAKLTGGEIASLSPESIAPAVDAAGRLFRRTHFYADPGIVPGQVDEMYRQWASNTFLEGWGDEIRVIWNDGQITGFFSHSRCQRQLAATTVSVMTNSFGLAPIGSVPGLGLDSIHETIHHLDTDLIEMTTNNRNLLWRVYARLCPLVVPFYTLHGWAQ